MKNIFLSGRTFLSQKQGSILSAAFLIMAMNIAARILGLIKYLVLGHYFTDTERSLFLAAFFPSETLFEILVSGSLAAAFIPVFTSLFSKGEKERAWYVAGITQTTVFLIFSVFAVFTFIFADQLLGLVPNIPPEYSDQIVALTRFLLIVQIFFILSFTLGPIQETFGRFLVPAMAPLFYNLGIIAGIVFLHRFGLWGPAIGAAFGALMSFIFQYPFAKSLGFRFIPKVNLSNPDFRRVIALASPRMLELIATRAAKSVELFLAFMISTASYGFFVFANALQLIPVALFGYSFSRAAMPTLSAHVARGDRESFERTFGFAVGQVIFFTVPVAILLAVLRIPIVRIAFGAEKFSWEATVQTGYILSAFAIGLIAEGIREVLVRSFYARHDTRTPLVVSLISTVLYITGAYWLIRTVGVGVWGIALAFSIGVILQTIALLVLLNRKIKVVSTVFYQTLLKTLIAGSASGFVMFFLMKILDQAVWDKKLSFLGTFGLALPTGFQNFVLDTRYSMNLVFLTLLVAAIGIFIYLLFAAFLKIREVEILARWVSKLFLSEMSLGKIQNKEEIDTPAPLPPSA